MLVNIWNRTSCHETTFDDHSQRSLGILPTHDQKEHNYAIEATFSQREVL